jgi:hypothetical protein
VAGGPYAITIGTPGGGTFNPANYAISFANGSFAVTRASLTLTAINQSKVYGSTFAFTGTEFSASGLKNGESVGFADFASTGAGPTAGVAGSPYAITVANPRAGTFDASNYSISYNPGLWRSPKLR